MGKIEGYQAANNTGILLNANEAFDNLNEVVYQELIERLPEIQFNRYPDNSCLNLRQKYAENIGIRAENCIVGNGSDEMLGLMIGCHIQSGKKCLSDDPDFSMYDYYCSFHDGKMVKYPWIIEKEFDVEKFIELGKKEQVSLVLISNPNNPTGRSLSQETLIQICEAFESIPVVIDEAYVEFDEKSMLEYIHKIDNLYITRTLSKAYGLAGIRCGFLISSEKNIRKMNAFKVPYNVNQISQLVAEIVLSHPELKEERVAFILSEKERVYQEAMELKMNDFMLYPSKTNYLYGKMKRKEILLSLLEQENIQIRNYQNDSFRITIGSKEENNQMIEILRKVKEVLK